MGRPRKEEKQKETAELMISVEDFARTRDSVVTGLTTLQTAVSDLLRSYLKHTNSVLGSTPYRLDTFGISNPLNNNEILAGALRDSPFVAAQPATAVAAVPSAEEEPAKKGRKPKKEKKEKKEKDPNEPKRPLTIYFLFSAHARPIVKSELGEKASKGEVEEEIKKRWRELGDEEKAGWKDIYAKNREEYTEKMAEYKGTKEHGAPVAAETPDIDEEDDVDTDEEAATAAGADADSSEESSDEEETEKSPTPAPKAPTPPAKTPLAKRRKTGKENGVVAAVAATPAAASPIPLPSHPKPVGSTPLAKSKPDRKAVKKEEPKAPELPKEATEEPKKKRGRKSKNAEEFAAATESAEPEAPATEKKNKRKRKNDV